MITLADSAKNTIVNNIINQNTSVQIGSGCILEYNMNSLVDGITTVAAESSIFYRDGTQPFKKLFPIDAIVKPFRPVGAGVRYAINGDLPIVNNKGVYPTPRATVQILSYRMYYPGPDTKYKYWVSKKGTGADITVTYPKTILTNKIVIRFELSHSTPTTWNVYKNGTSIASGTDADIKAFSTNGIKNYDSGTLIIYYNGASWTTSEPLTPQTPIELPAGQPLRLTTGAITDKYIGVIEVSPRWYKDISDKIVDFTIAKESSSESNSVLPVGMVTANSLSMNLISYESPREVISFDKTFTLYSSKTYLYKQIEIRPYFKIYHATGTYQDSRGKYEKIPQGVFFCDTWDISEFGDVSLFALDGAKFLQETLCPDILCESYTVFAIFRRLLDAVGFTNYNFNFKSGGDDSILTPVFWWSFSTNIVWDKIQELCRDSQIVATFDENNVLQFYTREYLFDSTKTVQTTFRDSKSGSNLSNILSFTKKDIASVNRMVIVWNPVTSNQSLGDQSFLWKSQNSELAALSLIKKIEIGDGPNSVDADKRYMSLRTISIIEPVQIYEYSGYLAIDSEIIEYDAVQYNIIYPDGVTGPATIDVKNTSDNLKYYGESKAGSQNFQPNGKYRIKSRGAFGTTPAEHIVDADSIIDEWQEFTVTWNKQ